MSVTLHGRLLASQTASPQKLSIVRAIEDARNDLRRIEGHMIHGIDPPGVFTMRKIATVASRLLQAVVSEGVADAVELPADCEARD